MDPAKLNWESDDGINFPMINDFVRNMFYERILTDEVRNKVCLEIGFGTGLLSLVALKHGAKKIIAYESNKDRYNLGKQVISELGLDSKIQLINDKFCRRHYLVHKDIDIVFCEIVDSNLWGEGAFNTIPLFNSVDFIPSIYFFEIWYTEISDLLLQRILQKDIDQFNPGIDINLQFINCINLLGRKKDIKLTTYNKNEIFNVNVGHRQYHQLLTTTKKIVKYELDVSKKQLKLDNLSESEVIELTTQKKQKFIVNTDSWKNKNILLLSRVGMKHKNHVLYLDEADNWGPTTGLAVIAQVNSDLSITHDFITGEIKMEMVN